MELATEALTDTFAHTPPLDDPRPAPADATPAAPAPTGLVFSGDGAEYFRIWAVNLTLTICTLSLYSAWAKVRRLRYFYQHTSLDGSAFDYTANPLAILFGRLLALGLLVLYYLAFEYSPHAGLAMVLGLIGLLPYLLWQSNRFKARNTRYRGLEFGFEGNLRGAYQVYVPMIAISLGPAAAAAYLLDPKQQLWVGVLSMLGFLLLPIMHALFRQYVQSGLRFGDGPFSFSARIWDFVKVWLRGFGVMVGLGVATGIISVLLIALGTFAFGKSPNSLGLVAVAVGLLTVGLGFSLFGGYFTARFQSLVWNKTRIGNLALRCNIKARKLIGLQFINTLLILLTLGLYRPFAAIRIAKFRLECVSATELNSLNDVAAGMQQSRRGATGEGVGELFDMDVGL